MNTASGAATFPSPQSTPGPHAQPAVVVHVRGERFVLDKGMLDSDAPNMFTTSSTPPTVFQRSPVLFALIVDHLCGYPLPDPLPPPATRAGLLADARFYKFQRLERELSMIPPFFGDGKGFTGPVVDFAAMLRGELPAGVAPIPRRGLGRLEPTSMAADRWLPVLIRASGVPVFFSLSLVESPSTPSGFKYSTRFVLGLTGEQTAALRAHFPDTRAARAFQFNEFKGHYTSWPTMAEAHLPHDGVAMRINGVGGTDATVRAWARSISMRPYGEGLDPDPLQDVDARKFVSQLFPPATSPTQPPELPLPADTEQWHYWRLSRILWAHEIVFCLSDPSFSPSLVSVCASTAMGVALAFGTILGAGPSRCRALEALDGVPVMTAPCIGKTCSAAADAVMSSPPAANGTNGVDSATKGS